jgi:2-keto-3-deoxy-L-rhamnonate aldolase RhmA
LYVIPQWLARSGERRHSLFPPGKPRKAICGWGNNVPSKIFVILTEQSAGDEEVCQHETMGIFPSKAGFPCRIHPNTVGQEYMNVRSNRAKEILKAGGTVFSTSVRLSEPGLCEILGYAGFDFVLLDGEHGVADGATIDRMVLGCLSGNTVPIVRVLRNDDPEAVMQALDLGAQGILLPHCRTVDDARRLRRAALYPPLGERGFGPGRGALWGRVDAETYFTSINDTILLLALIEDPEGVEAVETIAECGLDVLWVGTGDLAMGYGVPGQRQHPRVMDAADRVLKACKNHNVAAGYPAGSVAEAVWAREQGYRAIGFGGAEQYVMQYAREFLEPLGR